MRKLVRRKGNEGMNIFFFIAVVVFFFFFFFFALLEGRKNRQCIKDPPTHHIHSRKSLIIVLTQIDTFSFVWEPLFLSSYPTRKKKKPTIPFFRIAKENKKQTTNILNGILKKNCRHIALTRLQLWQSYAPKNSFVFSFPSLFHSRFFL